MSVTAALIAPPTTGLYIDNKTSSAAAADPEPNSFSASDARPKLFRKLLVSIRQCLRLRTLTGHTLKPIPFGVASARRRAKKVAVRIASAETCADPTLPGHVYLMSNQENDIFF